MFDISPSPLNAIVFLNINWVWYFSFETQLRKSLIVHYLSPGRKLPLEVEWWAMASWFCLSSFNWIAGWTIWDEWCIMATADLLSPVVLQVCCASQLCSGLIGSQGSKQWELLHPISDLHLLSSKRGRAICVCLLQKRLCTICLQQAFKKDKLGETHPTSTQIHPREMSCRLLTMSAMGRHSLFGCVWTQPFKKFF